MSNAKDLGHPRPVETIQKTENQVKPRREDQILSEGGDQIRQIDCKAVVRLHSFLSPRSSGNNTKNRESSQTSQRGSNSFRGGRSNSSNRLQGSSSISQLSTSYEQRQRSRSPRSSENNTKNRESSQTYYEQRQRSRSPIESFEPSDGDRSPRSPSPPDDQLASAEDDSNTDVVYPMTEERKSLLCFFSLFC